MHNTLQLRVKSANYMQILIRNVRIADKWHLGDLLLKFIAIVAPPRSGVMCTKLKYREEKKKIPRPLLSGNHDRPPTPSSRPLTHTHSLLF